MQQIANLWPINGGTNTVDFLSHCLETYGNTVDFQTHCLEIYGALYLFHTALWRFPGKENKKLEK